MSDSSDTALPRRRRRRRKATAATPSAEPAVQVILEQALHPDPAALDAEATETSDAATAPPPPAAKPARRRGGRTGKDAAKTSTPGKAARKGQGRSVPPATVAVVAEESVRAAAIEPEEVPDASLGIEPMIEDALAAAPVVVEAAPEPGSEPAPDPEPVPAAEPAPAAAWHDVVSSWSLGAEASSGPVPDDVPDETPHWHPETPADHDDENVAATHAPPPAPPSAHALPHAPVPHHWVYLAVGLFVAALGFGVWGVWSLFFAGGDGSGGSLAALRTRSDRLSQEVSTLRRSDQISRDANRDLERTLAERDEEIASLRADIAFYERFVGATGQRRGLSVHDLEMRRQDGDAWHFVATLTQNVNRGAVNNGRLTLSIEGTRRDRMERLSWTTLRKQPNAPGAEYSFKYFQQLEGEILLPADFKPLRVTVRLVPQGGAAVEQSFPWPETLHSVAGG